METKEEIKQFIDGKEYGGALLLTGSWGCGKTHLINKVICELNNGAEYLLVIVSLFGVDSVSSLNQKVKEAVLYAQVNKSKSQVSMGRIRGLANQITSALSEYSKIAKGINTALSINFYDFIHIERKVQCIQNGEATEKQLVLIFDDLERCKIGTVDLLGAINAYSEGKHIKTILIADEEKMREKEYSEFKEKLISRTIKFSSNYSDVIATIIADYNETYPGYQAFLSNYLSTINQVFEESKTENLRSIKSYLIDFERIFAVWVNSGISMEYIGPIFYMFGAMTFGAKDGSYHAGSYGFLMANSAMKEKFSNWKNELALQSIRNWAVAGIWDEAEIINELQSKYCVDDMSDDQKFLAFGFWDLEQQYITNGMPIAIAKAYNGELTADELIDLLNLLKKIFVLRKYHIPFPCDVNYLRIESGFMLRRGKILSGTVIEPKRQTYTEKSEIEEEAYDLYRRIELLDEDIVLAKNRLMFEKYLRHDPNISAYSLKGLNIGRFDLELAKLFLETYCSGQNYWRRETSRVLLNLGFKDTIFINQDDKNITVENLSYLIQKLQEQTGTLNDCISIAINNSFTEYLSEFIEQISHVDVE